MQLGWTQLVLMLRRAIDKHAWKSFELNLNHANEQVSLNFVNFIFCSSIVFGEYGHRNHQTWKTKDISKRKVMQSFELFRFVFRPADSHTIFHTNTHTQSIARNNRQAIERKTQFNLIEKFIISGTHNVRQTHFKPICHSAPIGEDQVYRTINFRICHVDLMHIKSTDNCTECHYDINVQRSIY